MRKALVGAAVVLAAGLAGAQQQDERPPGGERGAAERGQGGSSDAFDRACVDLLHGRTPQGEKAINALKDACAALMAGRADERLREEREARFVREERQQLRLQEGGTGSGSGGQVQPGRGTAQPQEGQGIRAAFGQAASEMMSPGRHELGMRRRGPVGWSLVSNPIGYFTGLGVNATLSHAFEDIPRLAWVVGGRYSTTDASNGSAQTFGALGGIDLFILGRNNEGLRIGPRLEVAAGRERFQGNTTYARLGMAGEVGYNFIATNGITGQLGLGLGGRVAGDDQNDTFSSFVGGEFGPYLNVGLGYSW